MNNTILNDCICPPLETITINQNCSLTEYGIFISSIILASSSFITSVLNQIQKSRCKTIDCVGTKCIRDIEN
jgi:hypothetical protein